jgi:hypothetical protein
MPSVSELYSFNDMTIEYGALGRIRVGRRNGSASAPVTLSPPKIPYVLTWERTQAATLEVVHPRNS